VLLACRDGWWVSLIMNLDAHSVRSGVPVSMACFAVE